MLLRRLRLDVLPAPPIDEVMAAMPRLLPLMRHRAHVAVVLSALLAKPDWRVSENERHFNPAVARFTGLRVVTPSRLLRELIVAG